MRRSYDPQYGSREQLRDSRENGMKVARERDKLKTENAEIKTVNGRLVFENQALTIDLKMINEQLNLFVDEMLKINELKAENAALQDELTELKALIAYITQGE